MSASWQQYIPHNLHQIFWVMLACLMIYKLSALVDFLTDCLSEQKQDCTKGKGSSKRLILFLFAAGFIYAWINSVHSGTKLDPYVSTLIIIFLLLGLAILKPDQATALLNQLKGLMPNLTSANDDQNKSKSIISSASVTQITQEQNQGEDPARSVATDGQ